MSHSLFAEMKRRNVFKAGAAYLALGWVVTQVTSTVAPLLHLPDSIGPIIVWIGVIGFPFVIMFSWAYEITPEGIRRENEVDRSTSITHVTGRRLDYTIIGLLLVAIALFAVDRFMPQAVPPAPAPAAVASATPAPAAAVPAPANEQSIAVLPFVNLSTDKDQEFFSDGISEELLNLLAKIPQLQVTARTSSFYFKGKDVKIQDIARQLHVAHILEGSVQKSGNQVRITVQLVDAGSDTQRWSQTWDRNLDDIFKIQDEIAGDVVKALQVQLLGAAPTVRTTDPQAYALYLQARALGRHITPEAFAKSEALYRQVLAIDPRYTPAWDGLAENFYHETNIGMLSSREGFGRAREAAQKALSIEPDYAPAHAKLGWIAMYADNDLAAAATRFEHALALDPANLSVLGNASVLLGNLGRSVESLALGEALIRRDPVNVTALSNLGYRQREAGRFDAAIGSYRTALSLSPGMGAAHASIGTALLLEGNAGAALAEIEQETIEPLRMIGLPAAYCALGRKAEAEKAFAALIGKYEKDAPYNIASDYAYCGDTDLAFEWLDKAAQYQDPGLGEIVGENLFAKIQADPRWAAFLHKVGKAPEQLAKIEFKVTLPREWQAEATAAKAGNAGAAD
jgi:TolB-like protein/cytochrome c-type biogenesis protein CcmH/NrfG